MLASLIIGLAWIVVFYVSQQSCPINALGAWNLVVGFGFLVDGRRPVHQVALAGRC